MRKVLFVIIAALALVFAGSALAGGGNDHYKPKKHHHHHHPTPPPCEWKCSPPPPVDVCPNDEGVQTSLEDCTPPPCEDCVITPVVVPPTPAGPNADAFCYGTGADSYLWATPADVVTFGWKTLHVAFVVKGADWSGVMTNGFKPYCGTGTLTGSYVDNQGWWTKSGLDEPEFTPFTNPNGTLSVPEHYAVVTP